MQLNWINQQRKYSVQLETARATIFKASCAHLRHRKYLNSSWFKILHEDFMQIAYILMQIIIIRISALKRLNPLKINEATLNSNNLQSNNSLSIGCVLLNKTLTKRTWKKHCFFLQIYPIFYWITSRTSIYSSWIESILLYSSTWVKITSIRIRCSIRFYFLRT